MKLSKYEKEEAARTLPNYMLEGLFAHIEDHRPTGGFLTALFENDLMLASQKADNVNQRHLYDYARWLFNYAPTGSYGSRELVREWLTPKENHHE